MAARTVYEKFDAVMTEAAAGPCPSGHTAMIEKLSELAQYLPQFPAIQAIKPSQHIEWSRKALMTELTISLLDRRVKPGADVLDAAEQEDYERAWKQCLWHMRRASGLGGSEIGTVVLNMSRGETGDFGSAHNIVKDKLLMTAPQIGEPAMRRGHHMEEYVRGIHHRSSGEVADENSLEALRGFRSPKNPYIIGTPDDITLRVRKNKRERVLLDYKCPGPDVLDKYKKSGVPFGYVAQLHHYLIVAKDAGVKINALQLVPFDYVGGADTLIMPVDVDPALEEEIKSTAQMVWEEFVMLGRVPEKMSAPKLVVDAPEVGEAMRRAGVMHAIAAEVKKRADEMKNDAIMMADQNTDKKALGRIDAGFYYIARDPEWDEEALRELASKADVDPEAFMRPSKGKVNQKNAAAMMTKIQNLMTAREANAGRDIMKALKEGLEPSLVMEMDLDGLAKAIGDKGLDVTHAYVIKERAGLTMKQNGPDAEAKAVVMQNAANLINEVTGMIDLRIEDFTGDYGMDAPEIPDEDNAIVF